MRGAPGLGSSHTQGNFSNQSNIYLHKYKDMQLSKCCDAEIKIVMVDDHVGHGIHEELECSNCGELFPEIYEDEETGDLVNTQCMTQTAIDWLEDELKANLKQIVLTQDDRLMESIFQRARSKHEAQLRFAWEEGAEKDYPSFQEFYSQTFKTTQA